MEPMTDTTEIRCPHCAYEWEYGGTMDLATCPNCSRKVNVQVNTIGGTDQ